MPNLPPAACSMSVSRRQTAVPLVVILLGYMLRLYRIDFQSMWWDEIFSFLMITLPPQEMLAELVADRVHPPLYYYILDGWALLGQGAFWLRYPSLLLGVLTLPVLYRLGRALAGQAVAMTAAFLLAISPFHIWYSQETRMHTLAVLAVTAAQWFLWRGLHRNGRQNWVLFTLCQLTAVYAHYFAWLIILAQYAFLSLSYRQFPGAFRNWLASTVVVAFGFGAWAAAVISIGHFEQAGISWISPVRLSDPLLTLLAFSAGPTIDPAQAVYWLVGLVFLAGLALSWRQMRKSNHRILFLWLFVPLLLTFLISLDLPIPQKRSIYMDRNLIIILPGLLLFVSMGLARRRALLYLLLPVAAVNLAALNSQYHDPQYYREDWQQAMIALQAEWQTGDVLLITPSDVVPIWFYGDADLSVVEVDFDVGEGEIEKKLTAVSGHRIWLLLASNNINPHGFPQKRNHTVKEKVTTNSYHRWLSANGNLLDEKTFPGVSLSLFQLKR